MQADDIRSLRAEDASGSFGLLPGHVDFLTVLLPTVVRWQHAGGRAGFCAVEGGVLSMFGAVVGSALGIGVLRESATPHFVAGAVLVLLAGIYLTVRGTEERDKSPHPPFVKGGQGGI